MVKLKLEKAFNSLKDNNLLFIFLNYIIKTSTYRNIGAFFMVARMMHAYKNLLVLLKLHVSFYTF